MMPNTSVNPAASRNSSRPNCSPLSSCSTTRSMVPQNLNEQLKKSAAARGHCRLLLLGASSSHARLHKATEDHTPEKPILLHRTLVVEAVLIVLDDGGHRFQRELAFGVLDH